MTPEQIQIILNYVSGPIIGAIIGLFTNYLAVKMLFRPYYPKKIGKWTLPFTPGIIPKRKDALAHAIGLAVGEELFTSEDISKMLTAPETEDKIISEIRGGLTSVSSHSIDDIVSSLCDEVTASAFKDKLAYVITEKLISATSKMNIGEIVASKGKEAILEKKASMGMLGIFLTDGVIDPLLGEVKDKVSLFLDEEGVDSALPAVRDEVEIIASTPLEKQLDFSKIDSERLDGAIRALYRGAVAKAVDCATASIDIVGVVEGKVKEMSVKELEALCLKIMKKELNAIVYLGGIIGLIMGIVNIFI